MNAKLATPWSQRILLLCEPFKKYKSEWNVYIMAIKHSIVMNMTGLQKPLLQYTKIVKNCLFVWRVKIWLHLRSYTISYFMDLSCLTVKLRHIYFACFGQTDMIHIELFSSFPWFWVDNFTFSTHVTVFFWALWYYNFYLCPIVGLPGK